MYPIIILTLLTEKLFISEKLFKIVTDFRREKLKTIFLNL